uniref:DNA relaxase mbeA n=1 Tax=Leclercia adecarboxylata TaxID=83655 RepID=A0A6H0A3J9_9ENTR|nr:hypothetical protein [Leclercia adecarboxylata]
MLSFAEADLPPGQREKLIASFERVLMPGLDKDQYSVLWVEHTDKGRLELNFLIPNTELLTGKRLQPYLGSAWKTESMVTPVFATPILTTSWLA